MNRIAYALMLVLLSGIAKAETAYVTDMLQLDMYATPAMTGGSIKKLRSGDSMKVLERDGRRARVRAGGMEGWVKSLYIVNVEPARARVNQLERSNAGLENTVNKLRAQLEVEQSKVSELTASQGSGAEQLADAQAELEQFRAENQRLENKLDSYAGSVPLNWLLIVALISLAGGGWAGWYYIDRRSRARHGGYRVY